MGRTQYHISLLSFTVPCCVCNHESYKLQHAQKHLMDVILSLSSKEIGPEANLTILALLTDPPKPHLSSLSQPVSHLPLHQPCLYPSRLRLPCVLPFALRVLLTTAGHTWMASFCVTCPGERGCSTSSSMVNKVATSYRLGKLAGSPGLLDAAVSKVEYQHGKTGAMERFVQSHRRVQEWVQAAS